MKKLHLIGFALFAAFAFSAIVSASAFATGEFLVGGAVAKAGEEVTATGEIELSDLHTLLGAATVLCSGQFLGHFTGAKEGVVTEVLDLVNTLIPELTVSEAGILCTKVSLCEEPLLQPEKLPFPFKLELSGGVFKVDLEGAYEIECMKGVQLTDLCEGLTLFLTENGPNSLLLVKNLVEDEEEEAAKTLGTCNLGGANSGDVLTQGEVLMTAAGGVLSVS